MPFYFPIPRKTFDVVVDVGGTGDYTTLQAADNVLDAGAYSMWVKQGTYAAGVTVDTDNVYIFFEPGTVVQAAMTFSGDGITVVLGAQCDVQGLITLSGANGSLICHGGVDTDGLLIAGNNCYHDGGGWDTLHAGAAAVDGIQITGTDAIVQNCAASTTAGGGNELDSVSVEGARCSVLQVKVPDSDSRAINIAVSGATDALIQGCVILGADDVGIRIGAPRARILNNFVIATGSLGISTTSTGDNTVINGNIVQDPTGDPIDISGSSEDCVVVGNRTDGAVDDNSGTSTVASNEETAF